VSSHGFHSVRVDRCACAAELVAAHEPKTVLRIPHFAGKNPLGGDKEIARAMRKCLRHGLDAVAPVFRNEAFDPISVVAIKDQVFRALDNEAVEADNFGARQPGAALVARTGLATVIVIVAAIQNPAIAVGIKNKAEPQNVFVIEDISVSGEARECWHEVQWLPEATLAVDVFRDSESEAHRIPVGRRDNAIGHSQPCNFTGVNAQGSDLFSFNGVDTVDHFQEARRCSSVVRKTELQSAEINIHNISEVDAGLNNFDRDERNLQFGEGPLGDANRLLGQSGLPTGDMSQDPREQAYEYRSNSGDCAVVGLQEINNTQKSTDQIGRHRSPWIPLGFLLAPSSCQIVSPAPKVGTAKLGQSRRLY
jgi:hypothetical protein